MFLTRWLKKRRRPPNPIPAEVDELNKRAEELRRLIAELNRDNGRHA